MTQFKSAYFSIASWPPFSIPSLLDSHKVSYLLHKDSRKPGSQCQSSKSTVFIFPYSNGYSSTLYWFSKKILQHLDFGLGKAQLKGYFNYVVKIKIKKRLFFSLSVVQSSISFVLKLRGHGAPGLESVHFNAERGIADW